MSGNNVPKHGGNLYAAIRQKGGSFHEFIDFSANINPLGLSDSIRKAIYQSLESIVHYPDAQGHDLKQSISSYYRVQEDQITLGNGAVELMYVLCHTLKPKTLLVTAPTFSEYESAGRACGAAIEYFYLEEADDFIIDIQGIVRQLPAIDIVFICNPNNPTGTLLSHHKIEELLIAAKEQQTYVVVDESFIDFLADDQEYTCRSLLGKYDNLVILHSLTKFYAIPGLRLGFSLAHPALTQKLHQGKDPWNVNTLAQQAGVAALSDQAYQQSSKETIKTLHKDLYESLRAIPGLKPYPPSVNFILINIKDTKMTAAELRQALSSYHILIRDCSNYPGLSAEYVRVAVKSAEQNKLLIAALQQIIGGIK